MNDFPVFTSQFIPVIIVVFILVKFRSIINQFKNSSTTDAFSAKSLEELNIRRGGIFNRLVNHGVLIQTEEGRYYLSEENLDKYNKKRRKIALFSIVVLAVSLFILNLLMIKYQ